MSGRERTLVIFTLSVVGLFAIDRLLLAPIWEQIREQEARREALARDLDAARELFARRRHLDAVWREQVTGSLATDPSRAESQILHALRDWSQESGLLLSSVRPEGAAEEGAVREVAFHVVGVGPMRTIARFLFLLETASAPLRIRDLQLAARKEGADDLSLQLRLSTLYQTDPTLAGHGPPPEDSGKER